MIRKFTDVDRETVMKFLIKEPSINLFIIGDIEAYGLETEFQEIWGEFRASQLRAVLLRYFESFIFYANGDFDLPGFAKIIKGFSISPELSGKSEIVEQFEKELQLKNKKVTFFAECRDDKKLGECKLPVRRATLADIDRIIALLKTIDEFSVDDHMRERMMQKMKSGTGRTYYVEQNGKIVATASTSAENSRSAMIVGVGTHKSFRQKGYATACVQKLVRDLLDEGKYACLFYDNPRAGRIYKRLGFKEIGLWTMYG